MNEVEQLNGILDEAQSNRICDHIAELVCNKALAGGLRFEQSVSGAYEVKMPLPSSNFSEIPSGPNWDIHAAKSGVPKETPTHNPRYVDVHRDEGGQETLMVGFDTIDRFGKDNDINLSTLRANFRAVLKWSPEPYLVKGQGDFRSGAERIGLKLNALPMMLRTLARAHVGVVYGQYTCFDTRTKKDLAKQRFIAFCQTVLTPPSDEVA